MSEADIAPKLMENFVLFLVFLTISAAVTFIAYSRKYFSLPFCDFEGPRISFKDVAVILSIFFGFYMFVAPEVIKILFNYPTLASNPFVLYSIMQLIVFSLTVVSIFVYNLFQDREEMLKVIKQTDFPDSKPIVKDVFLGFYSWLIAIPVVLSVAQLSEIITKVFFGIPELQQLAVKSLKNAMESPFAFVIVLISILVFAPFLEEYLFRGILQSWLKRKLGALSAIFIAAAAFAFMHYAPQQGWTNIPLIFSLFAFGSYLGFVYEKSRSLFTPIVLHVTFNFISVMRIILLEGN